MVFKFIPVTWGTKFHISSSINRDLHVTFSSSINQKKEKKACLYLSAHRATIEFIVPFQPVATSPLFSLCRFIAEPITWFISILCKCFRSICAPAVLIIQFALGLCVVFRFQYHWSALIILSYYTFIRRHACYMLPRSLLYLLGPCINSPSCLPANEVHFKVILKLSSLSFCTQNQPNQHLTNVQVTPEACVNEWINFNWLWGRPGTEVHFCWFTLVWRSAIHLFYCAFVKHMAWSDHIAHCVTVTSYRVTVPLPFLPMYGTCTEMNLP